MMESDILLDGDWHFILAQDLELLQITHHLELFYITHVFEGDHVASYYSCFEGDHVLREMLDVFSGKRGKEKV